MKPTESLSMLSAFQAGNTSSNLVGDTGSYNAEGGLSSPPGFWRDQERPLSSPPPPDEEELISLEGVCRTVEAALELRGGGAGAKRVVYFIGNGKTVKIGNTRGLQYRLPQLRSKHGLRGLEVLAWSEGDHIVERMVQGRLRASQDTSMPGSEWFLPTPEVQGAIDAARGDRLFQWIKENGHKARDSASLRRKRPVNGAAQ